MKNYLNRRKKNLEKFKSNRKKWLIERGYVTATEELVQVDVMHGTYVTRAEVPRYTLYDATIQVEKVTETEYAIKYGPYRIYPLTEDQAYDSMQAVTSVINQVFTGIKESDDYYHLTNYFNQRNSIEKRLRDDLAVIIMRRIVPGKCKYCPL